MILAKPPLVGGLVAMTLAFSQKYWVSVIIPIDELHHFSEGWLNHQPDPVVSIIMILSKEAFTVKPWRSCEHVCGAKTLLV